MAFCPECGKPVTAEASNCASCGHELEAKPAGPKTGAARFKGTMLMATAPVVAKPSAGTGAGADKPGAAKAPAAVPTTAAAPAAPPANQQGAGLPAGKPQAKSTIIGTGLAAAAGGPANALSAPKQGALAGSAAAKPATAAAAPVARAAAPSVGGAGPRSTVLGQGVTAPGAAAASAHVASPAAAPVAAAAAGAAAQAMAARPAEQAAPAKPDDSKRNIAYAQTQHHGAFAAASQAALAAGPAVAPRTSPNIAAAPAAADAFDAHAETDPPEPLERAGNVASEPEEEEISASRNPRYLPGDPMAPQPQSNTGAQRAPMLRYDDSVAKLSRTRRDDKKWVWVAAGVIMLACLALVFVLASRMGH